MKKAALFVISALLLAISLPVLAQEFPDVPPDHWAYDAIQELVDAGIIQGYPDGTFGGKRAMTRYEFAEALAKAIPVIAEMAGGGGVGPAGPPGPAGPAGPVGPPGAGAEEVQALRQLVDEFRDELAALGVDVEALRRDVDALNERVTALEEEVSRVRLTGEVNLIGRGEVQNSLTTPFDRDSRELAANAATGQEDNPLSNSSFFTDWDFMVKGRVSDDATINGVINAGDYLSFAIGSVDDFTLWNLYGDLATRLGPLGTAQVVVGRFPFQLTPLTLKFVDPDSYTNVSKLDGGDYVLDGGRASLNLGRVALNLFAAKAQPLADLISPDLLVGAGVSGVEVPQLAGVRAVIGTGFAGNLGLTYYQAGASAGQRSEIMGADINTSIGSVGISAEWAQSDPNTALKATISDSDNSAWYAKASYQTGKLSIGGGFSTIESNYHAPGYWSRTGRAVNLVNVEGPSVNLDYALTDRISLTGEARFLEPNDDALDVEGRTSVQQGRVVGIPATALDKITYWRAGIKYGLTAANSVDLGWEQVNWEPESGVSVSGKTGDTEERYISIGIGHSFNSNASLKLLYQIVEYQQGGIAPYLSSDDYRGSVATAQFQLKY